MRPHAPALALVTPLLVGCAAGPGSESADAKRAADDATTRSSDVVCNVEPSRVEARAGGVPDVTVRITNRTHAPARLDLRTLSVPQLALLVTRDGHRVAPMSPPVPRPAEPEDVVVLRPGEAYAVTLRLDGFSPPLAAGAYVVRCASLPGAGSAVTIR